MALDMLLVAVVVVSRRQSVCELKKGGGEGRSAYAIRERVFGSGREKREERERERD